MRPLGLRVPVPSNDLYFVCDAWLCFLNAFQAAFVAVCVHNYITVIACIWILLCLGGAMLPPLTGILMASVDAELRTFASGFSMFMYNVLGYALGTFLPGLVVDVFGSNDTVGWRLILCWSFLGVVGILFATRAAQRAAAAAAVPAC
eukprot:GHVT01088661.1.p2 GENE.GHVT01088661.1~~GHVT01088661.1.p2  ORF type:complete len:147 (-),score=19.47 GHVT01088661.1:1325-1765(-)